MQIEPQLNMTRDDRTLVLMDGGLSSLVALSAVAARPGGHPIVAAAASPGCSLSEAQRDAARKQARIVGVEFTALRQTDVLEVEADHAAVDLLKIALAAGEQGCRRVLWPVLAERDADGKADLDDAARILDRSLLAGRLASLDVDRLGLPEVTIETPYLDFEDWQLADLAMDLDVPVELCSWWHTQDEAARAERRRWVESLGRIGWIAPEQRSAVAIA